MTKLQVFDKPLCCSSGVCGTDVDPALVTFSADLQWLERKGVEVQRINPAHQAGLFAASELVREELKQHGNDCLPVVVVDDAVVSRGVFCWQPLFPALKEVGIEVVIKTELPKVEEAFGEFFSRVREVRSTGKVNAT